MKWMKNYKQQINNGYCCICGSKTNMKLNIDWLCPGFGMGGLNPSSNAFCHNLYRERKDT